MDKSEWGFTYRGVPITDLLISHAKLKVHSKERNCQFYVALVERLGHPVGDEEMSGMYFIMDGMGWVLINEVNNVKID